MADPTDEKQSNRGKTDSTKQTPRKSGNLDEDEVEEASEESFPASDSPAWNSGHKHEQDPSKAKSNKKTA